MASFGEEIVRIAVKARDHGKDSLTAKELALIERVEQLERDGFVNAEIACERQMLEINQQEPQAIADMLAALPKQDGPICLAVDPSNGKISTAMMIDGKLNFLVAQQHQQAWLANVIERQSCQPAIVVNRGVND